MSNNRTEILAWIEQGRLPSDALPRALRLAGLSPGRADWRKFFNHLALWLAAIFCAAAVIFFFAYNWQAMGRFAKFGLVEILIIAGIVLCWRLDLNRVAGQSALLFATLLVGGLLALAGQTYQTGADTYELFGVWALAVLPWVAVSCFSPLWLFWLGLINLAAILYYQTFGGWFGFLFDTEKVLWALFILNTAALCCWEFAAYSGVSWLRERWSVRILAVGGGGLITSLALWAILDFQDGKMSALLVYSIWMAVAYVVYRHVLRDVFVLAGGVLSAIIVITVLLSKLMLKHNDEGSFLFIGFVIIGLSAAGGFWLKQVVNEEQK
ncbi:MAG: DUF2157 domain-containing protein [Methylococcaceae bacterium]